MIRRTVVFSPEAQNDLRGIYDLIADAASPAIALSYIERIEAYLSTFDLACERGTVRDDIRKGLRTVGFERRITIAFTVASSIVTILRLFYAGRNWSEDMSEQ